MRLIDADELKEYQYSAYSSIDHFVPSRSVVDVSDIDAMPTIETEKHGHWINAGHDAWNSYRRCSVCGKLFTNIYKEKYCSECGAKMDEEGENKK